MVLSHNNLTVIACIALSTVLGSIHAFSVFVPQWELLEGRGRAGVSLIYSIALVSLTVVVLMGYRVYQSVSPFFIFLLVGIVASLGLFLSAVSSSLVSLYLSYGILFGGANGLGYGYALQLSGQARRSRRGLAMGLVTAFYAVGATVAPMLFVFLIGHGGNALALKVMSAIVLVVAIGAAALVRWSNATFESESASTRQALSPVLKRARTLLWIGYGCAVAAGLMVIGHAYGIASWLGLNVTSVTWAATVVAFGNMLGGFSAGYYADRLSSRTLLFWLPLLTSLGLMLLVLPMDMTGVLVLIAIALVGYCYGAIIAVYPVAVADIFGTLSAPRIYGQIFTAWGLAGLLGPWVSGWLFDQTDSYNWALVTAILLSGVSIVAVRCCLPGSKSWVQ